MMENRCYKCEKRVVGCHSLCEDYKRYKENLKNKKEIGLKDRVSEDYFRGKMEEIMKYKNKHKGYV